MDSRTRSSPPSVSTSVFPQAGHTAKGSTDVAAFPQARQVIRTGQGDQVEPGPLGHRPLGGHGERVVDRRFRDAEQGAHLDSRPG